MPCVCGMSRYCTMLTSAPIMFHPERPHCWQLLIQAVTSAVRRSFVKVGAMVFLCHDINDIFMEGAKMARYADHKWLPTALFAVFMLSWFTSRIYYFPVYVIRSVYYEPIEVRDMPSGPHSIIDGMLSGVE